MSKAKNYFKIIELRRSDELSKALKSAAKHVTSCCSLCPLVNTTECAMNCLPPVARKEDGNPAEGVCEDWLFLHFCQKGAE